HMATKNSQQTPASEVPSGAGMHIGIVVSDWNREITDRLYDGCRQVLTEHGVKEDHIVSYRVPGSFELPMGARLIAAGEKFDAIVCIGCVIKGETRHDEYIAQAVSNGLMHLSLTTNIPMIFCVLTPNDHDQAVARAGGALGNKGEEAAIAALQMGALKKQKTSLAQKIGFS
ncbi:MAG: 6,7-dimethyl-8-ribityllumazine synthase, partial [Saprospiraceae bacterium]|nr:6,7-dimethyl-8-ribityllumazine synthase [Saprospiraceae bacterium]